MSILIFLVCRGLETCGFCDLASQPGLSSRGFIARIRINPKIRKINQKKLGFSESEFQNPSIMFEKVIVLIISLNHTSFKIHLKSLLLDR